MGEPITAVNACPTVENSVVDPIKKPQPLSIVRIEPKVRNKDNRCINISTIRRKINVGYWSILNWNQLHTVVSVVIASITMTIGILIVCFTARKPPDQMCQLNFRPTATKPIEYRYGSRSIAVADLNNDTYLDMIIAFHLANKIAVYMGDRNGTFSSPASYSTDVHSNPYMVMIGHLNNDSYLDIAVANFGTNNIGIFYGFGNGSFASQIKISTDSSRPIAIIGGYFNNDTLMDLAIANYGHHSISIYHQYSNGSFSSPVIYPTGYDSFPSSLAVGDLNNDKYADLVVANYGTNNIMVFFGSSNNTFLEQITVSAGTGSLPCSVVIDHFNDDDFLDIAVTNSETRQVGVLLNKGDATFTKLITYSTGSASPYAIATGDLNQDQRLDIIITNRGSDNIGVLLGDGHGNFANPFFYSTGSSSSISLAICDFNKDHRLDVAIVNNDTDAIDILFGHFGGFYSRMINTTSSSPFLDSDLLANGDFNNDNRLDIAVSRFSEQTLTIFLGDGNGSFEISTSYQFETGQQAMVVGDFNNDSRLDIVVFRSITWPKDDYVHVFIGDGNGSFENPNTFAVDISVSASSSVAIGDFNNDHQLDIVIVGEQTNKSVAKVLLGDGHGSFPNQVLSHIDSSSASVIGVAVADFNNDTRLDIAFVSENTDYVSVAFGNGNGSFGNPIISSIDSPLSFTIVLGDFNNDQQPDIVVKGLWAKGIRILLGHRNGSFAHGTWYLPDSFILSTAIGDFNNDTRLDIVTGHRDGVSILFGYGNGSFQNPINYHSFDSLALFVDINVGDFNKDTRLDMIVSNGRSLRVILQYNKGVLKLEMSLAPGGGSDLRYILIDDMNNDGNLDVVLANYGTNNVGIVFGHGNGSFEQQMIYNTERNALPIAIVTGDFNGDNVRDIAVANDGTKRIDMMLGKGTKLFTGQTSYETAFESAPLVMVAGDFNNDRQSEIAIVDAKSDHVTIFSVFNNSTFTSNTRYPVGLKPQLVAVGDFNNDSRLDIVVRRQDDQNLSVFLGDGNGSFEVQTTSSLGFSPDAVFVGDFNNDYRLDLAAINNNGSYNISILFGYGNGFFGNQITSTLNFSLEYVAVADINSDTQLDIVVSTQNQAIVAVLFGDGNGSFTDQIVYPVGIYPASVTIGDVNNDSRLDIVVVGWSTGGNGCSMSVLFGYENGSFRDYVRSSVYTVCPYFTAVGDFNNDARLDIVVGSWTWDESNSGVGGAYLGVMNVYLGYGNGSFGNDTTYSIGLRPVSVVVSDFNNDGRLDIVTVNAGSNDISVLLGYGNGSFRNQMRYSVGSEPASLAVGDFNNDSRFDLVVANRDSNDVQVLLGNDNLVFSKQTILVTENASQPQSLIISDFNNDGLMDIGVASSRTHTIGIFLGYGNLSFASEFIHSIRSYLSPCSIATGDFNNDTRADIVFASCDSANVGICLGQGNGSFYSPMMHETGASSSRFVLSVTDINNDTKQDVIMVNHDASTLGVFLGYGNGSFQSIMLFPLEYGSKPFLVAIGDLNKDRKLDLAIANNGSDSLSILLQTC